MALHNKLMQSSESYLGEHFQWSYQEQEQQQEQDHETLKTKKAPFREGPNCFSIWL